MNSFHPRLLLAVWLVVYLPAVAQAPKANGTRGVRYQQLTYGQWNGHDQDDRRVLARFGQALVNGQRGIYFSVEPDWQYKREVIIALDAGRATLRHIRSRDVTIFPRRTSTSEQSCDRTSASMESADQWDFKLTNSPDLSDPGPQLLRLVIGFEGAERMTQKWMWWRDGHQEVETLTLERDQF